MVTGNASEVQPAGGPPAPPAAKTGVDARWWVAALVVAAAAALFWPKGEHPKATASEFATDAMGQPAKISDQMGPVTLVHFWATWCPPCIQEIPALQRLRRDFSDRPNFKVVMIAVADNADRARQFLGGEGEVALLFDPSWDVAHSYGSTQLPETYLIDHGEVAEKFVGATNWDDAAVRKKIADRL